MHTNIKVDSEKVQGNQPKKKSSGEKAGRISGRKVAVGTPKKEKAKIKGQADHLKPGPKPRPAVMEPNKGPVDSLNLNRGVKKQPTPAISMPEEEISDPYIPYLPGINSLTTHDELMRLKDEFLEKRLREPVITIHLDDSASLTFNDEKDKEKIEKVKEEDSSCETVKLEDSSDEKVKREKVKGEKSTEEKLKDPEQIVRLINSTLKSLAHGKSVPFDEFLRFLKDEDSRTYHKDIFAKLLKQLEFLNQLEGHEYEKPRTDLVNFIFVILSVLKSSDIYLCKDILEKIAMHGPDLYVPITLHLRDHFAKEMVDLILNRPDSLSEGQSDPHHDVIFGHLLYKRVSTDQIIAILCKTCQGSDASQRENAVRFIHSVLTSPFISLSKHSHAQINKLVDPTKNQKPRPNSTSKSSPKKVVFLNTPRALNLSLKTHVGKQEKARVFFDDLVGKIERGECDDEFVREIAIDLKAFTAVSFNRIMCSDIVGQKWTDKTEKSYAIDFIKQNNTLSFYVMSHILKPHDAERRARWYEFFAKLAWESAEINNFSTALIINLGLTNININRLEKTLSLVSASAKEKRQT